MIMIPVASIGMVAVLSASLALWFPSYQGEGLVPTMIHRVAADPCFDPPTRQARLDCLNAKPPVTMGIRAAAPDDTPVHAGKLYPPYPPSPRGVLGQLGVYWKLTSQHTHNPKWLTLVNGPVEPQVPSRSGCRG